MSELDDRRFEHELAATLRRRDPGPAPIGLRERVARVPEADRQPAPLTRRLSRALVPVFGLAAAVLLFALALPLLASPFGGLGSRPGASAAPTIAFDPTLRGPGLVPPPSIEAEGIVVLGLMVAGVLLLAAAPAGPRRGLAALAVLAVMVVGGAEVLLTHAVTGPVASSGGVGMLTVNQADSSLRPSVYVTAATGEPLSFAFSVMNDGPLPVRVDGVVADPQVQDGPVLYPTLRAVWRNGGREGDVTSPTEPFAPIDLAPGDFAVLWLVETASPCAAGPMFDPATSTDVAFVGIPMIRVEYSVLGLPRTTTIDLPFEVAQPYQANCPAQP